MKESTEFLIHYYELLTKVVVVPKGDVFLF